MKKYSCDICNKYYASAASLWSHNKRYHNSEENKTKSISEKNQIYCNYCKKHFNDYSNRSKHHKICKSNPINIEPIIEPVQKSDIKPDIKLDTNSNITLELIKNLIPEIIKSLNLSQENISKVQPQIAGNENIANSGNNSHVGNNSNNINIISLGNENLSDVLSKNDQIKILKQKNDALLEIIKLVHFSSKYPQFHNIAIQGDKAYQYSDTENKFLETTKDGMLFDLIENRVNDIYGFNEENKLSLSKKTYSWIKCYTNMFEFESRIKRSMEKIEPVIEQESNKMITSGQITI